MGTRSVRPAGRGLYGLPRLIGKRQRPLVGMSLLGTLPALVFLCLLAAINASPVSAATLTVTRFDDPEPNGCQVNDCSLREAVIEANNTTASSTITLSGGIYHLTRPIVANGTAQLDDDDTPEIGDLDFKSAMPGGAKQVMLVGFSTASTIIDANSIDRIIDVGLGESVLLRNLALRNGQGYYSNIPGGQTHTHGGAIHNHGSLRLEQVTVSDSTATLWQPNGGGIFNAPMASLELVNTTIARNRSLSVNATTATGGGLESGGSLTAINATIVGNSATTTGGLKINDFDTFATLQSLILADNTGGDCGGAPDNLLYSLIENGVCSGFLFQNITGQDPQLLPVPNLDGYVYLYAPRVGSPVIDTGDDGACPGIDANATVRPQDGNSDTVPACDMGAVEFTRITILVTIEDAGGNAITAPVSPGAGYHSYDIGTTATFTAGSNASHVFLGWEIEHQRFGWASPMTMTVTNSVEVIARYAARPSFADVPAGQPYTDPVHHLAARGLILGYGNNLFGPNDIVNRAQMAALIARATPSGLPSGHVLAPPACIVVNTWDCEEWGNDFQDRNGLDINLWRNVGTLQHYGVASGYDGVNFGPNDDVTYAQTISFITRTMVKQGYWQNQPGAPLPYAGVPVAHADDIRTFAFYTGGVPDGPGPWSAAQWNAGATRGWFAQALWAALLTYWGNDAFGQAGYVP